MLKRRSHRFLIIRRAQRNVLSSFPSHPLTLSNSSSHRLQLQASFLKFVLVSSEKSSASSLPRPKSLTASYLDLIYGCLNQKSLDTPPKITRRPKDQKPHGIPTEKESIERVPSEIIKPHGTSPPANKTLIFHISSRNATTSPRSRPLLGPPLPPHFTLNPHSRRHRLGVLARHLAVWRLRPKVPLLRLRAAHLLLPLDTQPDPGAVHRRPLEAGRPVPAQGPLLHVRPARLERKFKFLFAHR